MSLKKSLTQQLVDLKGQIVWLASYPKSGNTWFRCFLSALILGKVDLGKLTTDGIFSARTVFDAISGIDGRFLLDHEVQNMIPDIYIDRSKLMQRLSIVKVHDAYIVNELDKPIFPTEISRKVVYLVRNPLDVVASFANHNASTIEETIKLMNNDNAYIAGPIKGLNVNPQFRQLMYDWSGHVLSWIDQKNVDVIIVRYEDMLDDGLNTFKRVIDGLQLDATTSQIEEAISKASFSKLQKKEATEGFKEKNIQTEKFFRSGKKGGYKDELTEEQIEQIIAKHGKVMKRLGYL